MRKDIFLGVMVKQTTVEKWAKEMMDWALNHDKVEWITKGPEKGVYWSADTNVFRWTFKRTRLIDINVCIREGEADPAVCGDGYYDFGPSQKESITVNVTTTMPLNKEKTRKLVYKRLVEILAHELQHCKQNDLVNGGIKSAAKKNAIQAFKKLINKNPLKLTSWGKKETVCKEAAWTFFIPAEVDAYVSACYVASKATGTSFKETLEGKMLDLKAFFKDLPIKEGNRLWGILVNEFKSYAKLKFSKRGATEKVKGKGL